MTTPSLRVYPLLYLPRCPTWTCAISKPYQIHIWPIYGSPPFLKLDFGLFSAVFLPLEPAIPFSHSPAVSPSQSRDFRLPEPTILFSNWSAVSPSKSRDFRLPEPAILFSPLASGFPHHVTSDVTRPIRSQEIGHLGALYYYSGKFLARGVQVCWF